MGALDLSKVTSIVNVVAQKLKKPGHARLPQLIWASMPSSIKDEDLRLRYFYAVQAQLTLRSAAARRGGI